MDFPYPPLPSGDGIRLLTLLPGDFYDPLQATLNPVSFSSKPTYLALSYTWADRDAIHAGLPTTLPPPLPKQERRAKAKALAAEPIGTLFLNSHPFQIGHNLTLALLYLRSPAYPLTLWVDAICINQLDMSERNAQVALMAFIFTRASAVVAWLGGPRLNSNWEQMASMRQKYERGTSRLLAEAIDRGLFSPSLPSSAYPSYGVTDDDGRPKLPDIFCTGPTSSAAQNPYWRRLWVVQEVCLTRDIVFLEGGTLWRMEDMDFFTTRSPVIKLLIDAQRHRFTEAMRLEALVEKFAGHGCQELRDRVYGLVGLACDVDSFSDRSADAVWRSEKGRGRGRGSLVIDYTRPFYDLWCQVVRFMHFRAKARQDLGAGLDEMEDERRVRVVRFAGVVQAAFEGEVDQERRRGGREVEATADADAPLVQAKGYIAGKILHLGPSYTSFVGSHREQQKWIASWEAHYVDPKDLEKIRNMEEVYSPRMIHYSDEHLARIRPLYSAEAVAWSAQSANPQGHPNRYPTGTDDSPGASQRVGQLDTRDEPVRFLATDHCMGLAPATTMKGDLIVRFYGCDAAIVVRPATLEVNNSTSVPYSLVGRADVVDFGRDPEDAHALDAMKKHEQPGKEPVCKGVYVRMDFATLQSITTSITT